MQAIRFKLERLERASVGCGRMAVIRAGSVCDEEIDAIALGAGVDPSCGGSLVVVLRSLAAPFAPARLLYVQDLH